MNTKHTAFGFDIIIDETLSPDEWELRPVRKRDTKHTDRVEAGWREKVRDWWYSVQDLLAEKDVCLHERKRVELEAIIKELEATQAQQVEEAVRKERERMRMYIDTNKYEEEDNEGYKTGSICIDVDDLLQALTPNHQD